VYLSSFNRGSRRWDYAQDPSLAGVNPLPSLFLQSLLPIRLELAPAIYMQPFSNDIQPISLKKVNPKKCCSHTCPRSTQLIPGQQLLRCSGCKAVSYCDRQCQRDAWALHKYVSFKSTILLGRIHPVTLSLDLCANFNAMLTVLCRKPLIRHCPPWIRSLTC
jgi:hypothetical protein